MNIVVWIVSILIIVSKYMDCWTTSSQITNVNQERNPLARKLMIRFGTKKVIWGIFVLSIVIVTSSILLLFNYYDTIFYKGAFIIIGLIVSITQFAVAHTNKTKKINYFTKTLLKRYR